MGINRLRLLFLQQLRKGVENTALLRVIIVRTIGREYFSIAPTTYYLHEKVSSILVKITMRFKMNNLKEKHKLWIIEYNTTKKCFLE